tara:strand:+ start:24422 stop:25354 length:933 start_codon:yes stop_codon:yes gene_type:complete
MTPIFQLVRQRFSFSEQELISYVNTAPYRYKTYKVKKRSGGTREISQPSRDLKILQRFVLTEFLQERFSYHDCATAYREKISISDNARPHLANPYLLKMDFSDFFPSIRADDFEVFLLEKGICTSEIDATMMSRIFFKRADDDLVLSIGSPGSPSISNAMLMDFDRLVSDLSTEARVAYTRYSDDLTFSTSQKDVLFDFPIQISEILRGLKYPRLFINQKKTVFSSKKFNRHVTGITITNDGRMSLGHERKRKLRTRVFLANELSSGDLAKLRGYLSFVNQIEPEFIRKLSRKYPSQMAVIQSAQFKGKS